ncbi:MAG: AraC family transcriptional regulator [Clostridia bacterium]|nr:AraC family transcriptional regulator [Clostridia bacterium]
MLKIFLDKDNIAFIGNQVNATEHSHCVLQVFLSLDEPLQVTVNDRQVSGKCIIVNKNTRHFFSCDNQIRLSILIEPSSNFAKELIKKIDGDCLIYDNGIEIIQQNATALIDTDDKQKYIDFINKFAEYLGVKRNSKVLDERINELLEILQNCDCYNHTIENFANSVCLSSSRLSHLFREQIGIPLKSYILFHQLEKAFTALLNGSNITDAAMLAGFDSPSHFAATVKKWMGMPVSASIKDSEFLKVFI